MGQGAARSGGAGSAGQLDDVVVRSDPTLLSSPSGAKAKAELQPARSPAAQKRQDAQVEDANQEEEEEERAAAAAGEVLPPRPAGPPYWWRPEEEPLKLRGPLPSLPERPLEEAAALHELVAEVEVARRQQEELAVAWAQVDTFLCAEGFEHISARRRRCCRSQHPLHRAVEENDAALIRALLHCGSDPTLEDSARRTPHRLASRLDRKGSHEEVLAALSSVGPGSSN